MESTSNNITNQQECSSNLLSPETIVKSQIKGNFSKILQQQSDTILALVGCVTQMNQVLLVQNQQLCNQSLRKNNNDDPISNILKHKMLTSFMKENKEDSNQSYKSDNGFLTPKEVSNLINSNFPPAKPPHDRLIDTKNGFPPSSVEQALNSGKSECKNPLDALGITGTEGKEFLRVLIHGITGNPELFSKIADGIGKKLDEVSKDSSHPAHDTLLSKTEELKKAAQEVANKSLSKQDEDQLSQLAKRIEDHDKELKAKEIETFLQSGNEINI